MDNTPARSDDPIKLFLLSVSVFCFSFSFLVMCALCYRQFQRIAALNEVGNFEVHFRSGILWLTGSQRQAEKIELLLQKLHLERRNKILKALEESKLVVKEEDLVRNENYSEENDNFDECEFCLAIPNKSTSSSDKSNKTDIETGKNEKRKVSGECIICLSAYKKDDVVLWSQNDQCPHAFHEDCILTWLMKKQSVECPCCRREFLDIQQLSKL